jgi:hypothetical protein
VNVRSGLCQGLQRCHCRYFHGDENPNQVAFTTALERDTSEGQAYLTVMKKDMGFTLLHNLQCTDRKIWLGDLISSKVVTFGGDIHPSNATPNVFVFDKEEGNMFVRVHLPPAPLLQTIDKYKPSLCNDQKYALFRLASDDKTDTVASTWMIPILIEWALMFADCPNFGTAFHCLVDLFDLIEKIKQDHVTPLLEMVALACCRTDTLSMAISTLSTCWMQLKYHATTRKQAEEAWLVHLHDMLEEDSQSLRSLSPAPPVEEPDAVFHAFSFGEEKLVAP